MFWRVDDKMYNVEELARACEPTLQRAEERKVPVEDMELLKQAVSNVYVRMLEPREHHPNVVPAKGRMQTRSGGLFKLKPSLRCLTQWTAFL